MKKTFGSVLASGNGLGQGFDFLRIFLAFSIVLIHSFTTSNNNVYFRSSIFWFAEYSLVPMFFALSGFLIAGSAQRLSLKNFLLNRGLRIFPALAVDVVICALIIGPVMTDNRLADYFFSAPFFKYFLNVVGLIHYDLPGVFTKNPLHLVNGSLWTVPWELLCYLTMSFIMKTGIINSHKKLFFIIAVFLFICFLVQDFGYLLPQRMFSRSNWLFNSRGSKLIFAFLLGIGTYQIRWYLPYSKIVLLCCIALICVATVSLDRVGDEHIISRIVMMITLVYVTIFVGLTSIPLPSLFHKGDYSYGVYLYHAPFLQILIQLFPGLFLIPKVGAVALFVFGSILSMAIAVFSWHVIEKPILALRKRFSFVAKARGVTDTSVPYVHHEDTRAAGSLNLKRTN